MASSSSSQQPTEAYLKESIGWRLESTAIAFIVIQTVCIITRTVSRRLQKTPWMWQDVFAPLGFIFNMVLDIMILVGVKRFGAGRHVAAVTRDEFISFFKLFYIAIPVIYCVCFTLPKLAILDIFLHVFIDKWTRILCYVTGTIIILSTIVNIPTTIWQCSPISHLWKAQLEPSAKGHCNNIQAHFLYSALPSILTDVVMLILPLPTIWKLHASPRIKLGLFATFATGSIGLITSILRFVGFTQSYADPTWASVGLTVWIIVETGTYLIAACFMTYNQLMKYIIFRSPLSNILSKVTSSSGTSKSNLRPSRGVKNGTFKSHKVAAGTVPQSAPTFEPYHDTRNLITTHVESHDAFDLAERQPPSVQGSGNDRQNIHVQHQFAITSSPV